MMKWFFIAIVIYSCNSASPIIPSKKMQAVLWDVMRADAIAQQLATKDSSIKLSEESKRLCDQVFLIHNITEEEFNKSYSYYSDHPDEMKIIIDSINTQQARINITEVSPRKNILVDSSKKMINKNE